MWRWVNVVIRLVRWKPVDRSVESLMLFKSIARLLVACMRGSVLVI